ncbi:aminotransferase class I/II-fold pyridoxal phosphate-dependent enzyme [Prauserella marina]|nr:aminotransferase class I/II-fold pyridoxal phosphate-dependent enzyme [Prauserella marina]
MSADHAPGQERSEVPEGLRHVDFSHGDVSAFPPPPEVVDAVTAALRDGGRYAYSPYRGHLFARELIAPRLSAFLGEPVDPGSEIIVTPGTQGGLFLALSSLVERGDKVAVVAPDYFANRKIVEYLEATPVPVELGYRTAAGEPALLDLEGLRAAFQSGARLLVFSNPNNPTGAVYTPGDIEAIAGLAAEFDAFVVVDQLYSRQIFDGRAFTHLRAHTRERCLTLLGPSKTESVSGCRVGVAVAPGPVVERMEQLQGIVSLRAAGYTQAALEPWFAETEGWLDQRIAAHALIRDELHEVFTGSGDVAARLTEGGSYLFLDVPAAKGRIDEFVARLRTEAAVTVTRGPEFGDFPASVRLNFSQDHQAAVDAARRIAAVAARL